MVHIARLNNYMFQPPYRPSSGCTPSHYKANHTLYNDSILSMRSRSQL